MRISKNLKCWHGGVQNRCAYLSKYFQAGRLIVASAIVNSIPDNQRAGQSYILPSNIAAAFALSHLMS